MLLRKYRTSSFVMRVVLMLSLVRELFTHLSKLILDQLSR